MNKWIFLVAKRGDILPILPLLGVFGSKAGKAAGIAKTVNNNKAAQRQLKKLKRHNHVMKGHGVYLAPYKCGRGVSKKKTQRDAKNVKECDYQRTIATTDKTYAHSVYFRSVCVLSYQQREYVETKTAS